MSHTILLSVTIITYNEEKNIHDCIASVHDFADEVVVLDSHSGDRTKEIAQSFPKVRLDVHDFDGHVQQKNRAIELAKGRWIFSLDADERATPELGKSIMEFIQNNPEGYGARVRRLTIHMGRPIRHGGWYNARFRLLRKGCGSWGGENPHDEIFIDGLNKREHRTAGFLKGDLIHYSFTDLSDQINTINKFSSIVAFNRNGKGKKGALLKMLYKPFVKFVETYILKGGFLDGVPGFVIAVSSSFSAFLKWAKLWELQNTDMERPSNVRPDYKVQ